VSILCMRALAGKTVLLLALAAHLAAAQQVRGIVRDSAANNPLSGVVVSGLDSAGQTAARSITDAAGRFVLLSASNVRRLHLIRIGYRPRDVDVAGRGEVSVNIGMERLPPVLNTVHVSGSELCPGSADRGAAFQLWEQARAGLLATIVARDLKPAMATTLVYESGMSPSDERIHRQKKEVKRGQTTRPFVASAGPSFFAEVGYMTEDPSGRLFNAPDADVLMHESFAATHCFHIQSADEAHAGQIGLAFSPIRGRDDLVDVSGVIWMDSAAPKLRSLDFAYTGLEPAAIQAKAGGYLEFRTMPNGVSFIERWHLRLANMEVTTSSSNPMRRDGRPPKRNERFDLRVVEIVEAGGIVLDATWADGEVFQDTPSIVSGLVTRRKANTPVAGAVITLAGTSDTAMTDNAGEFEIQAIPGRYSVVATDTTLRAFIAPRSERLGVDVAHGAVAPVHMEFAPIGDVVNDICHGQRMRDSSIILVGYVSRGDNATLRNTHVRALWQDDYTQQAMGITVLQREQDATVDDQGRFIVCGVARERVVKLGLRQGDSHLADTTVRPFGVGLTMTVDWRVPSVIASADAATLAGHVMSETTKAPIAGAEIMLVDLQRRAVSDSAGAFQLAGLPAGKQSVFLRHVGDQPMLDSVQLLPGQRVTRSFVLKRAVTLDTMRTLAAALAPELREFEQRRHKGTGTFLGDSLLRKHDGQRLDVVLQNFASDLRILHDISGRMFVVAPSQSRRTRSAFSNVSRCFSTVYVDGDLKWDMEQRMANIPFDISTIPVDRVAGVEYYAPFAPMPPQFKRSDCGTILIWTRTP
jgi:hypothetical protein